jgi:hypothetical protein
MYARGPALQWLTKEARADARDGLSFTVDVKNCFPQIFFRQVKDAPLGHDVELNAFDKYVNHHAEWRAFVMECLDSTEDDAKKAIMRIFFLGTPKQELPPLWWLAADVAVAKDMVLAQPQFQHLHALFAERPHPVASRLFYALSPTEDNLLHEMESVCTARQWVRAILTPRAHEWVATQDAIFDQCYCIGGGERV